MNSEFEVVFYGQVLAGKEVAEVRENLRRMFKADEAKLNALFSGKKVVIKSGLDSVTADKYVQALKRAGAQADKVDLNPPPPVAKDPAQFAAKDFERPSLTSVAEAQKVEDSLQEDKSESSSVLVQPEVTEVPEDEARQVMEAFRAKESQLESASSKSAVKAESEFKGDPVVSSSAAQDFSVAPVGELIPSIPGPDDVEIPDLDHLTVKPMDGYLVEPKPEEKVDVPDTSHLKLDD